MSTGLYGACLLLLLSAHPHHCERTGYTCAISQPRPHPHARHHLHGTLPAAGSVSAGAVSIGDVSVVDVAPGIVREALPALLHLRADERIVSVDDQPVADELTAGMLLAERASQRVARRSYLDLTVGSPGHDRRVLVLMR